MHKHGIIENNEIWHISGGYPIDLSYADFTVTDNEVFLNPKYFRKKRGVRKLGRLPRWENRKGQL